MLKRSLGHEVFVRDEHPWKEEPGNEREQRKKSQCKAGLMKPWLAQGELWSKHDPLALPLAGGRNG